MRDLRNRGIFKTDLNINSQSQAFKNTKFHFIRCEKPCKYCSLNRRLMPIFENEQNKIQ